MRTFNEIFDIAAKRKGGKDALEELVIPSQPPGDLHKVPDDRFLAQMAKCIFNAGFNWKVVEAKWPGFEEAFHGFDLGRVAMMNDDDLAQLASDERIIRHGAKVQAVHENALFLMQKVKAHGSVGRWIGDWPGENFAGLLEVLKKEGSRLGGNTGQYFLRFVGRDGFIMSRDVVARLIAEGVIDKPPTSKGAMAKVQQAFNEWQRQSKRSFYEISRVLAMSTG